MSTSSSEPRAGQPLAHRVALWFGSLPLLRAVLVWAAVVLAAFTLAGWVTGDGGLWTSQRLLAAWQGERAPATPLDTLMVLVPTVLVVVVSGFLLIRLRRWAGTQQFTMTSGLTPAEAEEADHRFEAAMAQLSGRLVEQKLEGVRALIEVADTYRWTYRQRVVDALCDYLRRQRGSYTYDVDPSGGAYWVGPTTTFVSLDQPVESLVLEEMRRHLRRRRDATGACEAVTQEVEDDQLWCECRFNLDGAILSERVDFDHLTVNGEMSLSDARLLEGADFTRTSFFLADFDRAWFHGNVSFAGASFRERAEFWGARFDAAATFQDAQFARGCLFRETDFMGRASFKNARLSDDIVFLGARFHDTADLSGAEFRSMATFENAMFDATTSFSNTLFHYDAVFAFAVFEDAISFRSARFQGDSYFKWTSFDAPADLVGTVFARGAYFQEACFYGGEPKGASFAGDAVFLDAGFSPGAAMTDCLFNDRARRDPGIAIAFPPDLGLEKAGLPQGASWARFDDKGNVIEVLPA